MRLNLGWLIAIISSLTFVRALSETAWTTAFCYSLEFETGSDAARAYTMELTSSKSTLNGELALDYLQSGYTHSSFLQFVDEVHGTKAWGQLGLDVPRGKDGDGDGFEDFFQVKHGVTNWTSSGAFDLPGYGTGPVTAIWNRPPGSSTGSCTLTLLLFPFEIVQIAHSFKILEYCGPLTYTRTPTNATGSVQLEQTCDPKQTMFGPIYFIHAADAPTNRLNLSAGVWNKNVNQVLNYSAAVYTRDSRWPTNYYGYLNFFNPSNPSEFLPYATWLLSIDDPNDSDQNGIPNLSDVPSTRPPLTAPKLRISAGDQNVILTVYSGAGYLHDIQTTTEIGSATWQTSFSLNVTNDPQIITVPKSSGPTTFWRLKVR